ncbi:hypothetical protein [Ralstonia phage RSP15]|uniref:hypothetical protein n=1 Tax=Ralstonia phage RSP15 TaxID=1785960 RepID=UPI00074D3926|nr:hypothetical protein BH754_gp242 [Ralstonia phage RSP15]BAU40064.1 hypothetical protein [Ralstonia phage RSP15]
MTGRELIEMMERCCDLDKEIFITDDSGKFLEIKNVDVILKRDPVDSDFDQYVNVIEVDE